jgi:hypothetical protein
VERGAEVIRALIACAVACLVPASAWADHGGELRSPGMNPLVTALVWAGAAFLVGMAVIGIVTVLSRRRNQ